MEQCCLLCPFSASTSHELSSHLIRYHRNDPSFVVKCGYCDTTYKKYKSYCRHLDRKHSIAVENLLSDEPNLLSPEVTHNVSELSQGTRIQEELAGKLT